MADTITLRVVTPSRLVIDETVNELTAPGPLGELGILPDHTSFMTTLAIGQLSYKQDNNQIVVALSGGYAEVLDNVVTVLANAAEFPHEIDTDRAENAHARATARLSQLAYDDAEFEAAEAALHRALMRLRTAGRPKL
jgi:F-type H+-transporting ATPase subunit epsilon